MIAASKRSVPRSMLGDCCCPLRSGRSWPDVARRSRAWKASPAHPSAVRAAARRPTGPTTGDRPRPLRTAAWGTSRARPRTHLTWPRLHEVAVVFPDESAHQGDALQPEQVRQRVLVDHCRNRNGPTQRPPTSQAARAASRRRIATMPASGPTASTASAQCQPTACSTAGTSQIVAPVSRNPSAICTVSAVPT
jgi:hypothetical protein